MSTKKEAIQYAQRQFGIDDDGLIGAVTISYTQRIPRLVPAIGVKWNAERKIIGLIQAKCQLLNINSGKIDGYFGPQTLFGLDQLLCLEKYDTLPPTWRDEDSDSPFNLSPNHEKNPHGWPTYSNIKSSFGQPGSGLITITAPFELRIAWNTEQSTSKITCHRMVAPSLLGILESTRDHYGLEQLHALGIDLYGGMYNHRKMRGGSKLSTHAWGVAIDIDPDHNQYKWDHTKAKMDNAEYNYLRKAFIEEGWVSLGESKDYDWMHFQAVRL